MPSDPSARSPLAGRLPIELEPPRDDFDALEGYARTLTSSGWYRVVRRFQPRYRYEADDGTPTRTALFVDVETTGLDAERDAIIELACVPFQYAPTDGRVFTVGDPLVCLEDPRRPIPESVTELTGLTNDMVRGQRIDDDAVARLLAGASLVIAHNARFDRRCIERRLPAFARKPWACSQHEVPWKTLGCSSYSLEYILLKTCGEFFDGHHAADDCCVGIHILASRSHTGALPMQLLLESARKDAVHVWAVDAPIAHKDALKARGYHWHPGDATRAKAWHKVIDEAHIAAERAWLAEQVYAGLEARWREEPITAMDRYSARG